MVGLNPKMNRTRILLACLALAVAIGVFRWLFAEPSITLNVKDAPLSKVLKEFERQGHIKLVSNLDPAKTVTLLFDKTPVFDALETLAVRTDASWRLAYIAAPKKAQIDTVLAAFTSKDTSQPEWTSYQLRGGGGGGGWVGTSDVPTDPRIFAWQVTPSDTKDLGSYFSQAAQKSPAFFALAPEWNPIIGKPPASGPLKKSIPQLVSQAGGSVREVIMLEDRPNFRGGDEAGEGRGEQTGPPADTTNRGPRKEVFTNALRRQQPNPEWMAQRAEEAIKQLPAEEQAQARQDMVDMRGLMEELRKLPPEERRAKMEEVMNDPRVAERMEQRATARDSRMSPSQRSERSKRYVKNKTEAREKAGNPMGAKN